MQKHVEDRQSIKTRTQGVSDREEEINWSSISETSASHIGESSLYSGCGRRRLKTASGQSITRSRDGRPTKPKHRKVLTYPLKAYLDEVSSMCFCFNASVRNLCPS